MDQIRNLSIRKTIVLYMGISLLICFFLSALIVHMAEKVQNQIWWNYVDEEKYFEMAKGEGINYMVTVPRPSAADMTKSDHQISEFCDFLQTYTVLIVSFLGSCITVFLFYRNKLQVPIEELHIASQKIADNHLDFHIIYENEDEMGELCREFERMREQLAENNQKLWRNIEEEKLLRAAIAHDIRSPLSVLKGYQEMLIDYLPDGTIDQHQAMDMLIEGKKQIKRMDTFVEMMQKMNSLEARILVSEEITGELLKNEIQITCNQLEKEYEKQCSIQLKREDGIFKGDRAVILEVTENLLSNGIRYAKKQVEVDLYVTDMELKICVKDDGVGFQKEKEELTKPFYQQNIKDSLKHAGIGMYISRLYCEKHGGRLLLENGEYGGAVITAIFCRIV